MYLLRGIDRGPDGPEEEHASECEEEAAGRSPNGLTCR